MANFPRLFAPGKIGSLELRNRIVMGAILTRYADTDGNLTDRHIAYFVERAKGGTALITTDGISPFFEGRQRPNQACIYDDRYIPRMRELAGAVHAHGAKLSVQLMHGGYRVSESGLPTAKPIGPSARVHFLTGVASPEATKEDIAYLVEGYAQAAYRCKQAGCDAVEMHAAHGYLGNQFLSPHTNKRTDEYGGSVENRCRFVVEIVQRIKQLCGADFPVIIKMNADDQIDGGITIEDAKEQAKILAAAGYDALLPSCGVRETMDWQVKPYVGDIPAFIDLPAALKQVVDIPVIAVSRIKTPALAERVLEEGKADFICIARALIADPYWPQKALEGRSNEIAICIGENHGCMDRDTTKYPSVTCTINPAVGREEEFRLRPATSSKQVVVLGGGLGGMRAAATLAERGHQVTLHEDSSRLGGEWNGLANQRTELRSIVNHLRQQMERHGVAVKLNSTMGVDDLRREQPDAVVVAARPRPLVPEVPGADRPNVVQANHVLLGVAETGPRAAVLGSTFIGAETALALARQGKAVSLIATDKMCGEIGYVMRMALLRELVQSGVRLFDYCIISRIAADHVLVNHDKEFLPVPADTVVLAVGYEHDLALARELEAAHMAVYTVPDSYDPQSAQEAIRAATLVGMEI